jgi:hypothetical protein
VECQGFAGFNILKWNEANMGYLSTTVKPLIIPAAQKLRTWSDALFSEKWQWIVMPLFTFLITRLGIFLAAYYGNILFPSDAPAQYIAIEPKPAFLGLLSKWDSEWYLYISTRGYYYAGQEQAPVAFFPLYPLLMKIVYHLLNYNVHLSGLLISNGSFLVGLIFFYRLVEDVYADSSYAKRAIFYLCVFPASMFFSAIYTEGLFFLLITGCVYFARKRKWWLAGLFGLFASATRNLGVLLALWVSWEWLGSVGWNWRKPFAFPTWDALRKELSGVAGLLMIPGGLAAYMLYLWRTFGDPLAFLTTQKGWDRTAIFGPIQVILQFISDYRANPGDPVLTVYHFSLILLLIFLAAMPQVIKRLGLGAGVFCLACVLIPVSTSLISLPRFIAPLFPFCMVLADWGKRPWVDKAIRVIFSMLLAVFTTVFTNWRFFF